MKQQLLLTKASLPLLVIARKHRAICRQASDITTAMNCFFSVVSIIMPGFREKKNTK